MLIFPLGRSYITTLPTNQLYSSLTPSLPSNYFSHTASTHYISLTFQLLPAPLFSGARWMHHHWLLSHIGFICKGMAEQGTGLDHSHLHPRWSMTHLPMPYGKYWDVRLAFVWRWITYPALENQLPKLSLKHCHHLLHSTGHSNINAQLNQLNKV